VVTTNISRVIELVNHPAPGQVSSLLNTRLKVHYHQRNITDYIQLEEDGIRINSFIVQNQLKLSLCYIAATNPKNVHWVNGI